MFPTKFPVSWLYGSGEEAITRFSRHGGYLDVFEEYVAFKFRHC